MRKPVTRKIQAGVLEPTFGYLATQALISAMELGLLQRLACGPATARSLARSAKAEHRAVRMLLNALVGMSLLQRRGDRYHLPPAVRQMLKCPGVDPETYFGDWLEHMKLLMADWSQLTQVVKTGKPVVALGKPREGKKVFPTLARRLFPGNYTMAKELLKKLPEKFRRESVRILDVAAGSAAWSIPFAEINRSVKVTAIDFEAVLEVARHFTRACGVEEQYEFVAGDIRRVSFGANKCDLVILGHICHSEGAVQTKRLFGKMCRALRPGGSMLIADFVADDGRTGRNGGVFPLLFALNMLVHTEEGNTFTFSEYRAWAKEAGFRGFNRIDMCGPASIMSAKK